MPSTPPPNFTIRIDHHLHHDGGDDLRAAVARIEDAMSRITEKLDRLEAAIAEAERRIAEDFAELQRRVDEGKATDDEVQRFEALVERLHAIDPVPDHPAAPDDDADPGDDDEG
jgi:septal ring factor EnvC (AmiA/AmiB activator)